MATNPPLFRPVTIEGMLLLHGQSCASADHVGIAEMVVVADPTLRLVRPNSGSRPGVAKGVVYRF